MRLSLILDARSHSHSVPVTRAFLRTASRQCAELLSICRITGGDRAATTASVHVVTFAGVVTAADETRVAEGERGLRRLLRALDAVERWEPDCPKAGGASLDGASFSRDNMSVVTRFLFPDEDAAAWDFRGDRAGHLLVFATSFVPYTELFGSLAHVGGSAALPNPLHCLAVDAAAVGVSTASLGRCGTLYCCSVDPSDLRAALQTALCGLQSGLRAPVGDRGGSDRDGSVQLALRLGAAATVVCKAQRPYLGPLLRCCTTDAFPQVQEARPSLVVQGCGQCARLLHSGFEVERVTASANSAIATLVLEAVLPPENVDETFLCDNTWVAAPSTAEASAGSLFDAAFSQFSEDVLVLRSGNGGAVLSTSHHFALQSICFVGYFVSRTRLVLRQVTPWELRRVPIAPPAPRTRQQGGDAVVEARLRALRAELLERCRDSGFNWEDFLQGGVCLLAAQLQSEKEYTLQLVKHCR